jgi:hypothetical protein
VDRDSQNLAYAARCVLAIVERAVMALNEVDLSGLDEESKRRVWQAARVLLSDRWP